MAKSQISYKCKDVVFHFNKKHLEDQTVPMWVLKTHGVTYYVEHVEANIPWTTKETPGNEHTKGSLKFKDCKLSLNDDNTATLDKLGLFDHNLSHPKETNRILASSGTQFHLDLLHKVYQHSEIKSIEGTCGSEYIICDMLDKDEMLMAMLKYPGRFRLLSPNERYYIAYETGNGLWLDMEDEEDD